MIDPENSSWVSAANLEFGTPNGTLSEPSPLAPLSGQALSSAGDATVTLTPALGKPKSHDFRVRLMRFDRPESRTVTLKCTSESAARARAAREAGIEWRIVQVSLL